MREIISKGNGRNYYGIDPGGEIHEIVRVRGFFYRTQYVLGEGLRPVGDALKKSEFKMVQ